MGLRLCQRPSTPPRGAKQALSLPPTPLPGGAYTLSPSVEGRSPADGHAGEETLEACSPENAPKGFPSGGDLCSPDSDREVVAVTMVADRGGLGLSFFLQPGRMGVEADH